MHSVLLRGGEKWTLLAMSALQLMYLPLFYISISWTGQQLTCRLTADRQSTGASFVVRLAANGDLLLMFGAESFVPQKRTQ